MIVERLVADRLEREPERRHARGGAFRAPARQAVEHEVDRSRRRGRRRRGPGRLRGLESTGVRVEAAGVHGGSECLEVGLARQRGVERLEPFGGLDEQCGSVAAAREDEREMRAQQLQPRSLKLVERGQLGGRQERLGGLATPGGQLGLRGGERASPSPCRVRGQLGCSLEEGGRGGDAAPALGAVGRALQLVGDRLVETGGCVCAMPCAAIRIYLGVGRLRQRAMHLLAFGHGCRPVDRRAHEWMAKAHPGPERDQLCRLGRRDGVGPDPESLGRPPQQCDVADRLGRRGEQQPLGPRRERFEAPEEALLDLAGQRPRVGKAEAARQLGGREAAGQLDQRERVAARLGDDPVADPLVEHPGQRRREQRTRVVVPDPLDGQLRQTGEPIRVARLADGEHHRDPLCEQAPRHERERLRGRAIEPLHIVDQAHQRLRLGRLGQEAQHRERDEEVIRSGPFLQPEGDPQRLLLRAGQPVEAAEHGSAQLMQARERELHLRLDARRSHDAARRRAAQQVLQQRGLAYAGFAAQDQHAALTHSDAGEQPVQRFALAAPTSQRRSAIALGHIDLGG